jgi:putative polyhydroxyalkanoate system protein
VSEAEYKILNKKFIVQKMKYINGLYLHKYISAVGAQAADRDHNSSGSDSDQVRFSRSGLSGTLEVTGERFRLQAQLGFLLSAFKDRIESEIQKNLDELIARQTRS